MPGRIRFYVGQIVVGAEILAIDTERDGPPRYQLRYACCGNELWISHAGMLQRNRRQSPKCNRCSTVVARKAFEAVKADREPPPPPRCEYGLVRDRNGQPWPRLGPLGPRWASGPRDLARAGRL